MNLSHIFWTFAFFTGTKRDFSFYRHGNYLMKNYLKNNIHKLIFKFCYQESTVNAGVLFAKIDRYPKKLLHNQVSY